MAGEAENSLQTNCFRAADAGKHPNGDANNDTQYLYQIHKKIRSLYDKAYNKQGNPNYGKAHIETTPELPSKFLAFVLTDNGE